MKRNIIIIFALLFTLSLSQAQVEFGVKGGVSSYNLADSYLKWQNKNADVAMNIRDASYGYHFGVYSRIKIFGLYLEPAVLFNSNSVEYMIDEVPSTILKKIKSERYQNINIPALLGFKLWFFRVQAGPVAHIFLNSSSELTKINGYKDKFRDATFGYQLGLGMDYNRFRFDVNFEGNFSNWGKNMVVDGHVYNFDDKPARIVASIGIKI